MHVAIMDEQQRVHASNTQARQVLLWEWEGGRIRCTAGVHRGNTHCASFGPSWVIVAAGWATISNILLEASFV